MNDAVLAPDGGDAPAAALDDKGQPDVVAHVAVARLYG